MATAKVLMFTQVLDSPFQDMSKRGFILVKKESLKDSILTGKSWWETSLGRPVGNATFEELGVDFVDNMELFDRETMEPMCSIEKMFGHHRSSVGGALFELMLAGKLYDVKGLEVVDLPEPMWYDYNGITVKQDLVASFAIQPIDDPEALKISINENKDDSTSPIIPLVEGIRQTMEIFDNEIASAETFEEYEAAGGKYITNEKAWQQLKRPGAELGVPSIAKFFGETFDKNHVEAGVRAVKMINAGIFEQDQIKDFRNVGLLRSFCTFAANIWANEDWPEYFKRYHILSVANAVASIPPSNSLCPNISSLNKAAKAAKDAMKEDKDGVKFLNLATKGKASKEFNPGHQVDDILRTMGNTRDLKEDPASDTEVASVLAWEMSKEIYGYADKDETSLAVEVEWSIDVEDEATQEWFKKGYEGYDKYLKHQPKGDDDGGDGTEGDEELQQQLQNADPETPVDPTTLPEGAIDGPAAVEDFILKAQAFNEAASKLLTVDVSLLADNDRFTSELETARNASESLQHYIED